MGRHYKKRGGQGKAASNGFLRISAGRMVDSVVATAMGIGKALRFKPFSLWSKIEPDEENISNNLLDMQLFAGTRSPPEQAVDDRP